MRRLRGSSCEGIRGKWAADGCPFLYNLFESLAHEKQNFYSG